MSELESFKEHVAQKLEGAAVQLGLLGDLGPPRRKRTSFRTAAIAVLAANRLVSVGMQRRSAGRCARSRALALAVRTRGQGFDCSVHARLRSSRIKTSNE